MKRFFIPLLVLVIAACSESIQEDLTIKMSETQEMPTAGSHFVSYSDIVALSKAENNSTRASSNAIAKIECITGKANDTLLYVCQKQEGGWTVYSSDTRVPAIVAQSDEGSFDELMQIEGAKLWILSMADDMAAIRQLTDDKLNFTREEIENNKAFWESISSHNEFVKKMLKESATRGGGHGSLIDPGLDSLLQNGLWVLRESYTYTEVYDSIPRLTVTNWHQDYPYNYYCPLISINDTLRAPAGCVAIAGAQMLYFLHNKLGVPEMAPSQAYCYGTIKNYLNSWDQTAPSSTIWNSMNNPGSTAAAPLIANVGKLAHMSYGISGSGAEAISLKDSVFNIYGIYCDFDDYVSGTLLTSLSSGMPVILCAESSTGGGHMFISDKYKRTRTVTANYYNWIYFSWPPNTPMPAIPEYVEYTYSSYFDMIGMNWGCGDEFNNNWYSITGDWIAGPAGNESYNWNINRMMMYGFSPIY